jgi:hypothetical protein
MNRWLLIGLIVAAVGFASWQWGVTAALPYLGFLICPLMCIGMGLFAYKAGKSGNDDKASRDSAQNTGD